MQKVERKFMDKVKKLPGDGCWLWQGGRSQKGYGMFSYDGHHLAHRYSYELHFGPIPKGLYILHSCDNPACVNPDHLEAGTQLKNMRDASKRDRMAKGVDAPKAKLTEDDVRRVMKLRKEGWTLGPLAKEFGVVENTIWLILSGRSWSHITGLPKKRNYNKPKCLRKT